MRDQSVSYTTKSIAESMAELDGTEHVPVTFDNCGHIAGPFFHGTKASLAVGDQLATGFPLVHQPDRTANNVYFAALVEPAIWAAELAVARAGISERGFVYVVEPTGPFEDDPNVTNKKFPGNVTRSYRTRHPMRIIDQVHHWQGHTPGVLQAMIDGLDQLRAQGLHVIYD